MSEELARQIPADCFTAAKPVYVPDHRDTRIVCEALATGATLLFTSNVRSIDETRINAWCEEHGARLGFQPRPVVYHADETLAGWVEDDGELEWGLHAVLFACWPGRNDAPSGEVFRKTLTDLRRITSWPGAPLQTFGSRLEEGLKAHPDRSTLIEEARRHLPPRRSKRTANTRVTRTSGAPMSDISRWHRPRSGTRRIRRQR